MNNGQRRTKTRGYRDWETKRGTKIRRESVEGEEEKEKERKREREKERKRERMRMERNTGELGTKKSWKHSMEKDRVTSRDD